MGPYKRTCMGRVTLGLAKVGSSAIAGSREGWPAGKAAMLTGGSGSSGLGAASSRSRGLGAVPCGAGALAKSYGQQRGGAPAAAAPPCDTLDV